MITGGSHDPRKKRELWLSCKTDPSSRRNWYTLKLAKWCRWSACELKQVNCVQGLQFHNRLGPLCPLGTAEPMKSLKSVSGALCCRAPGWSFHSQSGFVSNRLEIRGRGGNSTAAALRCLRRSKPLNQLERAQLSVRRISPSCKIHNKF